MKVRLIKKGEQAYIPFPWKVESEEVEIFKLKEGVYLLTLPFPLLQRILEKEKEEEERLREEEKLLQKLASIKFSERTLPNVRKLLSPREQHLLKSLIAQRKVKIFKSSKYPEGVINLPQSTFTHSKEREKKEGEKGRRDSVEHLGGDFIILKKGDEFIKNFQPPMYVSVVGPDGRIYIANVKSFQKLAGKVLGLLRKGEKTPSEIANALGEDEKNVLVVLRILWAEGSVLESKKGVFSVV